jgi:hypothetical protein
LEVDDDWVDPLVFCRFVDLLAERQADRRYTYLDLGGQDCLIGCCTDEQLKSLRKLTGLQFKWLKRTSIEAGRS